MKTVFVFSGVNSNYPAAVFSTKELAEAWIRTYGLSGTLTEMPLDISAYDQAIRDGLFAVKKPQQQSPEFMVKFSSRLWHGHYEKGHEGQFGNEEA